MIDGEHLAEQQNAELNGLPTSAFLMLAHETGQALPKASFFCAHRMTSIAKPQNRGGQSRTSKHMLICMFVSLAKYYSGACVFANC